MIPVSVVTGFLGSGKTTFIGRVLRDPGFARTAVIINEFGEVGLDHDLVASSDESAVTLASGCLCCRVQTDLARTLMDLAERRAAGALGYDRVIVETSGMSDPGPVLLGMLNDRAVAATHQPPRVVTVVDAVHGEATLREQPEARNQVAVADTLLISKTDLAAVGDGLVTALSGLNPGAARLTTAAAVPGDVFGDGFAGGAAGGAAGLPAGGSHDALAARLAGVPARRPHTGIETITLVRETPLPALALTMLLEALAEHCGPRLLRLKGLVAIEEMPGQPAEIHGVRHVVSVPVFLDRWPSGDQRTRIVVIARDVPRYFPARLLEAIESEVRAEMAARRMETG